MIHLILIFWFCKYHYLWKNVSDRNSIWKKILLFFYKISYYFFLMELYVLIYRSVQLDILYKRNILYILENYLITSSGIWSTGKLKKNTIYERIYVQNILFNFDILIFSILSFAAKNVSNESWRDIGILFLKNIILLQWKLFHNFFYIFSIKFASLIPFQNLV